MVVSYSFKHIEVVQVFTIQLNSTYNECFRCSVALCFNFQTIGRYKTCLITHLAALIASCWCHINVSQLICWHTSVCHNDCQYFTSSTCLLIVTCPIHWVLKRLRPGGYFDRFWSAACCYNKLLECILKEWLLYWQLNQFIKVWQSLALNTLGPGFGSKGSGIMFADKDAHDLSVCVFHITTNGWASDEVFMCDYDDWVGS